MVIGVRLGIRVFLLKIGFADFYTYNILIKEAVKHGDTQLAGVIFNEGHEKKLINDYTQKFWLSYLQTEEKIEKSLLFKTCVK